MRSRLDHTSSSRSTRSAFSGSIPAPRSHRVICDRDTPSMSASCAAERKSARRASTLLAVARGMALPTIAPHDAWLNKNCSISVSALLPPHLPPSTGPSSLHSRLPPSPVGFAQRALQELAGARLRQLVGAGHRARHLVPGEVHTAERDQLVGGHG